MVGYLKVGEYAENLQGRQVEARLTGSAVAAYESVAGPALAAVPGSDT